jgi:hypothetical protein
LDGYGIQIEGFEHRQMMNMMNYNYPYYKDLVENLGFRKIVDFVSSYVEPQNFNCRPKCVKLRKLLKSGVLSRCLAFKNKRDLKVWAGRIGQAYNKAL